MNFVSNLRVASPRRSARAVTASVAAALLLAACGGGGGGGGPSPDEVMGALANKVNVPGATVTQPGGSPPSANDNPPTTDPATVPQVDPAASTVNGTPGQKVIIPVTVTSSNVLANLYAKVPGASTYFNAAFGDGGPGLKNLRYKSAFMPTGVRAKGTATLNFEVDLPSSFPSGEFCFDFSARDVDELTSTVEQVCIIVGAAPTPTPTATPTASPTASPTPGPTPTPNPTTGKATDCFNPSLFAVGSRLELSQQGTFDGETSTFTQDLVAMRETTFKGNAATEVAGTITIESGGQVFSTENFDEFLRVDGSTLLLFGSTFEETVDGVTVSGEIVYEPAFQNRFDLNPGQSYSQTYTFTSSGSAGGQPFEFSQTETEQVTYVGQESITVPAGTFNACRLNQSNTANGSSTSSTQWFAVGSGIPLRTLFDDGEDIVTTSARINGAPVTGN